MGALKALQPFPEAVTTPLLSACSSLVNHDIGVVNGQLFQALPHDSIGVVNWQLCPALPHDVSTN